MDTKFTKGPWSIGPVDDCQITHLGTDGARYVIADISGDYNQPELWPIMEANARLIAAAPDMYEALILIKDWIMDPWTPEEVKGDAVHPAFRKALEATHAALAKVQS